MSYDDRPPHRFWDREFIGISPRLVLGILALIVVLVWTGFASQP